MKQRFPMTLAFFVALAACQTSSIDGPGSVTRAPTQNVDVCTPDGREAANPFSGAVNLEPESGTDLSQPAEELISYGNWVYREHLIAEQVAKQCDVDAQEWKNLASALSDVAEDSYLQAGISTEEMRSIQRRREAEFAAYVRGVL